VRKVACPQLFSALHDKPITAGRTTVLSAGRKTPFDPTKEWHAARQIRPPLRGVPVD